MSTIGKIEGERMAALACINRVLLRAAELDWESASLDTLEEMAGWKGSPLAPAAGDALRGR